jgi:2-oxoglutarate ferredoxin oxidoreductase subunit alpha
MVLDSINWMAGGAQGSGVDTAANIFGRACGYGGLYVFGRREYHQHQRLAQLFPPSSSAEEVLANVNGVNLLAAFDAETVVRHLSEVVPEGGDCGLVGDGNEGSRHPTFPPEYKVELEKFLKENGIGETLRTCSIMPRKTKSMFSPFL